MLAQEISLPTCFGITFFAPGEGPCDLKCRVSQGCRERYLERASTHLAALAGDERAFVVAQIPPTEPRAEAVGPSLALVPASESRRPRKPPAAWDESRRRPLASFKPRSVVALAADVLRAAPGPLHVCDIAAEVLALATERGVRLGGQTPAATVGLALRMMDRVDRVGRGTYAWRHEQAAEVASAEGTP